jgi:hypothetical protein
MVDNAAKKADFPAPVRLIDIVQVRGEEAESPSTKALSCQADTLTLGTEAHSRDL